jgi:hypothetical protein
MAQETTTDGSFFRLAARVSDLNIDDKPRPKPAARKLAFLKHSISLPDTNAPPSQLIPPIRHQESISWDATTARHHFQVHVFHLYPIEQSSANSDPLVFSRSCAIA